MNDTPSSRRRPGSFAKLMKIPACAGMTILFFTTFAYAEPYNYKPASCDFKMTFPEKPFIETKCGAAKDDCEEVATYTQSADASSLNFRFSCRKGVQKDLSLIKPEDLKKPVAELVTEANLQPYASDSAILDGDIKTAIALATGRRGARDVIYTAQIWIGKNSILSMESDMTGPENKKITETYTGIMRSIEPAPPLKTEALKTEAPKTELKKTP